MEQDSKKSMPFAVDFLLYKGSPDGISIACKALELERMQQIVFDIQIGFQA